MKRALVLSGGGAKGAYEIGVYKALRKLGIKIDIITGTSIGAINGALLASGSYRKAKRMWLNIGTNQILNYSFNDKGDIKKAALELVSNKGLKFNKAAELIDKHINEDKLLKSKIDFGLVTVNFRTRVPKMLTKEEIPKGKIKSYIIASSTCFPAVELKKIDNDYFADGGYYDNLPINLAIDMGAEEVIAVDLDVLSIKQKVKNKDVKIDYIKINDKKPFTINFNPKMARRFMRMGYNDTMKHFGKFDGNKYTFKNGDLEKNYNKIGDYYTSLIKKILLSNKKSIFSFEVLKNKRYKSIFCSIKNDEKLDKEVLNSLEYLGSLFDIEDSYVYNIDSFNKKLLKEVRGLDYITLDKNLKGKMLIGYIYNKYMHDKNKDSVYKKLFNIALVFQKDFLASLYLISISGKYPITLYSKKFYSDILKEFNN